MHYAQLELDRIKSNVRPQHIPQTIPNPVDVMESAYHLTTLDAQNEVSVQRRQPRRTVHLGKHLILFGRKSNLIFVHTVQICLLTHIMFVVLKGIVGSTTACIVVLNQDELRVANLGDCGISVIRRNHYVFRSEEQQHSFNFPYQLGTASFDSPMDAQVKLKEETRGALHSLSFSPSSAIHNQGRGRGYHDCGF